MGDEKIIQLELALHKEKEKIIDFCGKHTNIFFYGAGRTAEQLLDYFKYENLELTGIIVSNGESHNDYLADVPIYEIDNYSYKHGDGIILAVAEKTQKILFDLLLKKFGLDIEEHIYRQKIYSSGDSTSEEDWYAGTKKTGRYFRDFEVLETLGDESGTDKAEKCHNYLRKYDFFLSRWKDEQISLMELGVFKGQSLEMWEKYFSRAKIIGVDIDEKCKNFSNERKEIVITDLSKHENLYSLRKYEPTVIIDDASHGWRDQILALSILFPAVKSGGIFIMEDLGTSFSKHIHSFENDSVIRGYDFLALISEAATGDINDKDDVDDSIKNIVIDIAENVEMISFIYGACILVKR